MNSPRPHPFILVFGQLAGERFPAVREAVAGNLRLDHFLMTPSAVELLHELRPEEGLDDAVDDFVAFVHASFCYWHEGERTAVLDDEQTLRLTETGDRRSENGAGISPSTPIYGLHSPISTYVQIAPRILWSQVESSDIHEPIDGWFTIAEGDVLRVVACLGLHPERPGLSVLTAVGKAPATLQRDDGTAPYAPNMEGGTSAGLHSVADAEELLWLAWKVGVALSPES